MNAFDNTLQQARSLFEKGKYSKAADVYLNALKSNPAQQQKAVIWAELSWLFYQQKQYDRCVEACENVLELDADYKAKEDLFRLTGFSYSALSRMEEAIKYLEKSLKIDNSSQKQQMAVFELLKIHFRLQNYKESEKWINEVESYFYQNEKDYWLTLLFFKGFVKYYTNQVEESEHIFEELLENSQDDPRRATALFGLAFINFHRKNYLNTINLCETVTKHDPAFFDMESVGFLTAVSFKYLGRDDIFENYYTELKKNYPEGRYSAELAKIHRGENGEVQEPDSQS